MYVAITEQMVSEPLLMEQLHLIYASLYGTLLCQATIADCSRYTHTHTSVHVDIHTRVYTSLHMDTAAPMLATTQQLQESFTVCFTWSNHCLVVRGVCALCHIMRTLVLYALCVESVGARKLCVTSPSEKMAAISSRHLTLVHMHHV